jgi:hypothetical protein
MSDAPACSLRIFDVRLKRSSTIPPMTGPRTHVPSICALSCKGRKSRTVQILEPALDEEGRAVLPAGYEPGSSIDKLWATQEATPAAADAPTPPEGVVSRAAAADAAVMLELAKERISGSLGGATSGSGASRKPRSFMDGIRNAKLMPTPATMLGPARKAPQSARSADERIRADRKERMRQQGLTGADSATAWRAADRSGDGGAAREALPDGTSQLSRMLDAQRSGAGCAPSALCPVHAIPSCRNACTAAAQVPATRTLPSNM